MYIRSVLTLRGGADQASLALWVETDSGRGGPGRKEIPSSSAASGRAGEAAADATF